MHYAAVGLVKGLQTIAEYQAMILRRTYRAGDLVVYRKTKFGKNPGPRAKDVQPAQFGDDYAYCIDKYWIVAKCLANGGLVLETRTGKQHVVRTNDPNLRHAAWWERLFAGSRFPAFGERHNAFARS